MTVDDVADRQKLYGDAPKQSIDEDEFGLEKTVQAIFEAITARAAVDGYILGIQGSWGSGKSTLSNFLIEKIVRQGAQHQFLRFDPWLIGEKSALLPFFLGQLATKIDLVERERLIWWQRPSYWIFRKFRKTLGEKVRKYGEYAASLATPLGGMASVDPSGAAALAALGLKGVGFIRKFMNLSPKSIDQLKLDISTELKKIGRKYPEVRFLIFVDDTDRLEPSDAAEVLRLVRKVADFPLLSYIICFDGDILAHQISVALNVSDGREYIAKIFQNVFSMPPHEPFALRRYLKRLLLETFANEMRFVASEVGRDVGYREHIVLDVWAGKLLTTPRDVVRLYDAIKLGWTNVPTGTDFLDFVWLQIIKLKLHKMYEWTQTYLTNVAAYRDGGAPEEGEKVSQAAGLYSIMAPLGWTSTSSAGLEAVLPGVRSFTMSGENQKVFEFNYDEMASFERNRRLGSPSHWKLYFAFDLPSYALSDEDIDLFRDAAGRSGGAAEQLIRELLARPHNKKGHFVDVLLDRLLDTPPKSFSVDELRGMASVFADVMDELAASTREFESFGRSEIWRKAELIMYASDPNNFLSIVSSGKSINWLANTIRSQGFAHGLPEGIDAGRRPQWLNRDQLDDAIAAAIPRFRQAGSTAIFRKPEPLVILFCWSQLGDPGEVRTFVEAAIDESVDKFLDAMDAMRGWSSSAQGIRYPLWRENIEPFADPVAVKTRLENLSSDGNLDESARLRARSLLDDWTDHQR